MTMGKRVVAVLAAALLMLTLAPVALADTGIEPKQRGSGPAGPARAGFFQGLSVVEYTVAFEENGGSVVPDQTVADGGPAVEPAAPTRDGHTFGGWYADAELTTPFDFSTPITGPATIHAKWTINAYTVRFFAADGVTPLAAPQTVNWGAAAAPPAAPAVDGHTFSGWTLTGSGDAVATSLTDVREHIDAVAAYAINTYAVRFFAADGVAQLGATQTVNWGTAAAPPAAPAMAGHTFSGWTLTGSDDTVETSLTDVREPIDAVAAYAISTYNVTFVDHDGTVLNAQTVDWNTAAAAPADPERDGHDFIGWDKDFSAVTAALTVKAKYAVKTYAVRFFTDNGGTQIGATQTVKWGESAAPEKAPGRAGRSFDKWVLIGDDDTVATSLTSVRENIDALASYTLDIYTVVFTDHNGRVIGMDDVEYGSGATAPAPPAREGYSFAGWDASFGYVTDDLRVTALYRINTYTVTFMNYDGAVLGTRTVDWNTAAAAPAVPDRAGYAFTGWDAAFDAVTADMTVTAQFARNETEVGEPLPDTGEGDTATVTDEPTPQQGPAGFPWWWATIGAGLAILLILLIAFLVKRLRDGRAA
jgi:uncharacterized repeat protein (TIGR02543 family)